MHTHKTCTPPQTQKHKHPWTRARAIAKHLLQIMFFELKLIQAHRKFSLQRRRVVPLRAEPEEMHGAEIIGAFVPWSAPCPRGVAAGSGCQSPCDKWNTSSLTAASAPEGTAQGHRPLSGTSSHGQWPQWSRKTSVGSTCTSLSSPCCACGG